MDNSYSVIYYFRLYNLTYEQTNKMKTIYLVIILLLLTACSETEYEYPVVNEKIYRDTSYTCQFGVLYSSSGYSAKSVMLDTNKDVIPCSIKYMTTNEYKKLPDSKKYLPYRTAK